MIELLSTVAMQVRLPVAAPIQSTSWLPHWMSTEWCAMQGIQDDVGAGAPVEDVPHNVQVVDDQPS